MSILKNMVAVAGLAFVAAACTPSPDSSNFHWSRVDAKKENKVDWVELNHDVLFEPGSKTMSSAERRRLRDFITRVQFGYGDRLFVSAGEFAFADDRRKVVSKALTDMGFRKIEQLKDNGESGSVSVIVGRYVVTAPNCPDWRKPADADRGNTTLSNHGCSTVSNLGAMVAYPRDLLRGRKAGPADGDAAALGIKRYKAGEIIPLESETTSDEGE
jgi:pilus assembly protein CpaD